MTSKELIDMHRAICGDLSSIYGKKNHDYGDSFHETINKFGLIAAFVRMDDKMNRAITLTAKKAERAQVVDESLEDTLLDLANYAIMTVIELRRQGTEDLVGREEL